MPSTSKSASEASRALLSEKTAHFNLEAGFIAPGASLEETITLNNINVTAVKVHFSKGFDAGTANIIKSWLLPTQAGSETAVKVYALAGENQTRVEKDKVAGTIQDSTVTGFEFEIHHGTSLEEAQLSSLISCIMQQFAPAFSLVGIQGKVENITGSLTVGHTFHFNTYLNAPSQSLTLTWETLIACVRAQYLKEDKIKMAFDEAKAIDQCYVNLAIVEEKEQRVQLQDWQKCLAKIITEH